MHVFAVQSPRETLSVSMSCAAMADASSLFFSGGDGEKKSRKEVFKEIIQKSKMARAQVRVSCTVPALGYGQGAVASSFCNPSTKRRRSACKSWLCSTPESSRSSKSC